jgi:hypothetical protein
MFLRAFGERDYVVELARYRNTKGSLKALIPNPTMSLPENRKSIVAKR